MSTAEMQRPVHITTSLLEQLRAHGEETYPFECCGILLGKTGEAGTEVHSLLRAGNTRTDSAHNRYNIDPRELIAAQREGRKLGMDIVGFYHSHPDHPAMWSATDLAEAHWFGCSYLITAVEGDKTTGKATVTNSFLLQGTDEESKAFSSQPIRAE